MEKRDFKYILAYVPAALAFWGLYQGGLWTFSTLIFAFGLVPALEVVLPFSDKNHPPDQESSRLSIQFFDWLLYFNLPILFGVIYYYFWIIAQGQSTSIELIGMTMSVGVIVGTVGINVAHELGHRDNAFDLFIAKTLLLPGLYMHFNIEHNLGHHKHVATDKDPASARYGENLYGFWFRSVIGSYRGAWQLEAARLRRAGIAFWSLENQMIRYVVIQFAYLLSVGLFFGWQMIAFAIYIAVFGFLLLETVNYIEHYGLRRKKMPSGRYEKVTPRHSWNSDHEVGRILLYELTRHSDHHYKANRKYQILRHLEESPQLPAGYPAAMLLSLIPPLWFSIMNPKVKSFGG